MSRFYEEQLLFVEYKSNGNAVCSLLASEPIRSGVVFRPILINWPLFRGTLILNLDKTLNWQDNAKWEVSKLLCYPLLIKIINVSFDFAVVYSESPPPTKPHIKLSTLSYSQPCSRAVNFFREFKQVRRQQQRQREKTVIWLDEWRKIIVLHVRHALK